MYSNDVMLKVKCVFNRIIAEVSTQYFFYGIPGKKYWFSNCYWQSESCPDYAVQPNRSFWRGIYPEC